MKVVNCAFLLILLSPFAANSQSPVYEKYQSYGYEHIIGTTGINIILHSGDKRIKAKFSKCSDQLALLALNNLPWNIIYPNADGKNIIVCGILKQEVKHTKSNEGTPQPEDYQEFVLKHWYIKRPFLYYLEDKDNPLNPWKKVQYKSLSEAGYSSFKYKDKNISYAKYETPCKEALSTNERLNDDRHRRWP